MDALDFYGVLLSSTETLLRLILKLFDKGLPVANEPIEGGSTAPDLGAMKTNSPVRASAFRTPLRTRPEK